MSSAPAELSGLRFFVENARASQAAKEDVPGYTIELRTSLQSTLVRAGLPVMGTTAIRGKR